MTGVDLPCKTGGSVGGTLQRSPNDRWAQFFFREGMPPPPPAPPSKHAPGYRSDAFQVLLKTSSFLDRSLLCQPPARGHPKILDKTKLQDCKRVHLYADEAQNGCFVSCPFDMPFLPLFQVWANPRLLVLLFVLTAASLTILPAKDLSH